MRQISEQQLKNILDKHDKWLRNEEGGERADLRSANLTSANLITFQYQQHIAYYTFDGALRIGCIFMPITEWILGFNEIGKINKYNEEQILMYGQFINQCLEQFKRNSK